jgi:3-hydroxyacyl-CoA dehydrogenase
MQQVLIIGIGQFGRALATALTQKGVEVMAVDHRPEIVEDIAAARSGRSDAGCDRRRSSGSTSAGEARRERLRYRRRLQGGGHHLHRTPTTAWCSTRHRPGPPAT